MEYIVFPFGKYKGVKIEDLPSTYIVLALESFDLPDELAVKMTKVLLGRLRIYTSILDATKKHNYSRFKEATKQHINEFEKPKS
jgi:uncharacterized protein (DUF3820 family)